MCSRSAIEKLEKCYSVVNFANIYKIKTNPKMCILIYVKIQSDQPRITRNALKSQIFDLFNVYIYYIYYIY